LALRARRSRIPRATLPPGNRRRPCGDLTNDVSYAAAFAACAISLFSIGPSEILDLPLRTIGLSPFVVAPTRRKEIGCDGSERERDEAGIDRGPAEARAPARSARPRSFRRRHRPRRPAAAR